MNTFLFLYSVEDILRDRSSDPETILTNLGFASSFDCETQKARRIPVRFFVEPSKARGISVDNFIKTNPEVRRTLTERQSSFVLTSPQTSVTSSPFIANLLLPRTQSLGQLFTTETAPTPEVVEPEEKGQCDSDSVVSSLSGSRDCDVSSCSSVQTLVEVTSLYKLIERRFERYDDLEHYYHDVKNVPKYFLKPFKTLKPEDSVTLATPSASESRELCKSGDVIGHRETENERLVALSGHSATPVTCRKTSACFSVLKSLFLRLCTLVRSVCRTRKHDFEYECLSS